MPNSNSIHCVTLNGVRHSIKGFVRLVGSTESTVSRLIEYGITGDEIYQGVKTRYDVMGRHLNVFDIAQKYRMPLTTMFMNLREGKDPIETMIDECVLIRVYDKLMWYHSFVEHSKVSRKVARYMMAHGYTAEQIYDGATMPDVHEKTEDDIVRQNAKRALYLLERCTDDYDYERGKKLVRKSRVYDCITFPYCSDTRGIRLIRARFDDIPTIDYEYDVYGKPQKVPYMSRRTAVERLKDIIQNG